MTALREYQRLESGGLWRADAAAQRREVTVSFGNATLVISDPVGRPLTHWSLAAVARQNTGQRPAVFMPDADVDETLEIDDPLMIEAIEKVRKTLARTRPREGRVRMISTWAFVALIAAIGYAWLPGALREQAQAAVPQAKRVEIGAGVLNELQLLTGPVCRGQFGRAALATFRDRLMGADAVTQIVVMPLGQDIALPLPGGIIALDRALVERLDDPAVAAGFVLAAARSRALQDPLVPMLELAGFTDTLRLLATGDFPDDVIATYATEIIGDQAAAAVPEAELLPMFEAADVPSAPYGRHLQERGQPVMELIVADPAKDAGPVMSDGDWVALQGICDT